MTPIERRTATVDIYQGDYLDRLRHLERQYDAAVKAEQGVLRTMDEIPESQDIYEQHEALKAEADAAKIVVTVGALGRRGWRALVGEHPARDGNENDKAIGANEDTFKEALVPISVLSPEFTADDFDQLSDIDYDRIYLTAFALNRSPAASPKALESPASRASRKNAES